MRIQSIEPQISRLSRAEKAQLLQRLVQEVGNAWAYADAHPEEMDKVISANSANFG